ncbi:phosphatidylserine/phosphatidylglycerophosphate/cardiolipin synthase family protein [Massilia jejuensis]|uniref:Phosphatidylserine/phosphatidylglycerophosphate/ cardiolipin synthase family protein n=1 Tax=Massilia jejuensis TaxID=648894 RepID=A0ABW0PUD2_9BURK
MKYTEKVYIDEVTRKARGSLQWFVEPRSELNDASHPISQNNQLEVFTCGEKGFASIAADIDKAASSIDLCCWGFDPAMELVRTEGLWPRGTTFGDLLIAAGERGVRVRLLVWLHPELTAASIAAGMLNPRNLPGWTHDNDFFSRLVFRQEVKEINAQRMLAAHRDAYLKKAKGTKPGASGIPLPDRIAIAEKVRAEYCCRWFRAARGVDGRFKNIFVAYRQADMKSVKASLASEGGLDMTEYGGMVAVGSHHQKSILIDYAHEGGAKAVGYVMGLNSVTDYWDTDEHKIEDHRRERGGEREAKECVLPLAVDENKGPAAKPPAPQGDTGFASYKPYRDYACRLQGGAALIAVHKNFASAWFRATVPEDHESRQFIRKEMESEEVPSALLRPPKPGDTAIQIVRTQPEEQDKTIQELYFQATDAVTNTGGYIYVENQYFQYEAWTQRLLAKRKAQSALWKSGMGKAGKTLEDMPLLHVFIVAPAAERGQMVPRTYDALAVVGQHGRMTGQNKLIEDANTKAKLEGKSLPSVVKHANGIAKPTAAILEGHGLRVVASMLQVSGSCIDPNGRRRMKYREIYIHSKLLLINDSFFTLGSANLNVRSMAGDSELNLGTNDRGQATRLRKSIWHRISGGNIDGEEGSRRGLQVAFDKWVQQADDNRNRRVRGKPMQGFILPIEDSRSSTIRLG